MRTRACVCRREQHQNPDPAHALALLGTRREGPCSRRATKERDELASFQVIEFHSVPYTARAELQDIELAWISQELTERFYNLLAVGEGSRCLKPDSVIAVMSAARPLFPRKRTSIRDLATSTSGRMSCVADATLTAREASNYISSRQAMREIERDLL